MAPSQPGPRTTHWPIMRLSADCASDQGRRARNEDAAALQQSDTDVLGVIADGVGGGLDGDQFSQLAVRTILANAPIGAPSPDLAGAVQRALGAAHGLRQREPAYASSGSTLVVASVRLCEAGAQATVVSIGDSRAYLVDAAGAIYQLTRDHTYAEALIRTGMPAGHARSHPHAPRLTHVLGADLHFDQIPEVAVRTLLRPGDRLILCTDGVSKVLVEADMARLVARTAPYRATQRLISAALGAGAQDNVTALVIACDYVPRHTGWRISLGLVVALLLALGAFLSARVGSWPPGTTPSASPRSQVNATVTALPPVTLTPPPTAATAAPTSTAAPTETPTSTPTQTPVPTRKPQPAPTASLAPTQENVDTPLPPAPPPGSDPATSEAQPPLGSPLPTVATPEPSAPATPPPPTEPASPTATPAP